MNKILLNKKIASLYCRKVYYSKSTYFTLRACIIEKVSILNCTFEIIFFASFGEIELRMIAMIASEIRIPNLYQNRLSTHLTTKNWCSFFLKLFILYTVLDKTKTETLPCRHSFIKVRDMYVFSGLLLLLWKEYVTAAIK